jgi:hypothetical protein
MIRELVAVLISTLFIACCSGCEPRVCICDDCSQSSTANRSDYERQLKCVRCLEACNHE